MRRALAVAVGFALTVFLVAAVYAAPADLSGNSKQSQGIKNAKKAMQSRLERDKKMDKVRKQGQAKRHQAQSGK